MSLILSRFETAPEEKKKPVIVGAKVKFKNNGSNAAEGIKGAQRELRARGR
jgi:hypothetical protein